MAKSSIVADSCQRLPLLCPVIIWNCGDKKESVLHRAEYKYNNIVWVTKLHLLVKYAVLYKSPDPLLLYILLEKQEIGSMTY